MKKINWFQVFKYSVYAALLLNVALFLNRELISSTHRFTEGGFDFVSIIEGFTSTIDTAAWVLLLILFELETYVIDSEKLKGNLKWLFIFLRSFSYVFIVYSCFGYINNYFWLAHFEPVDIQSICEVQGKSWMIELDQFQKITAENCTQLSTQNSFSNSFFKYENKDIYTDSTFLQSAKYLSIIDLANSLSWILVVIVLEIDVWLQLKNQFKGFVYTVSKYIKNTLYIILVCAAVLWGINGKFLDFWDAFLWIVAFAFIEKNLYDWQKDSEEEY